MRIGGKRVRTGKLPYIPIFLAGLLFGTIMMNYGKKMLLENTGLLDEYSLYHMKYMTVDNNAFFLYVLRERLTDVIVLAVMATTYLGVAMVAFKILWYGIAAGMFLSAAVIRYGMKGILLVLTGVFPQYILYVPAIAMLMIWCERTCRTIYFKEGGNRQDGIKGIITGKIIQVLVVIGITLVGCFLESFVNPIIFSNLLKIF